MAGLCVLDLLGDMLGVLHHQLPGVFVRLVIHPRQRRRHGHGEQQFVTAAVDGSRHAAQTRVKGLIVQRVAVLPGLAQQGQKLSSWVWGMTLALLSYTHFCAASLIWLRNTRPTPVQ